MVFTQEKLGNAEHSAPMKTKPIMTLKMFGLLAGFVCNGQVDGGYYADPEDECQAFHIFTSDGAGGLAKYSFL